jgi:YfiR/HmsC-like
MARGGDNSLLNRAARGCALLLLAIACAARAAPSPQEYISGFVLYVRWPEDEQIQAWQVCVASPVTAADPYFATLQVRDRPFAVRHIKAGEALDGCQILDLTSAEPATAVALLKATQTRRSLLTVGNGRNFCSAGGMICLLQDQPRGGFEVNLSAIRGAGFNINARLLMMARQSETAGTP